MNSIGRYAFEGIREERGEENLRKECVASCNSIANRQYRNPHDSGPMSHSAHFVPGIGTRREVKDGDDEFSVQLPHLG